MDSHYKYGFHIWDGIHHVMGTLRPFVYSFRVDLTVKTPVGVSVTLQHSFFGGPGVLE